VVETVVLDWSWWDEGGLEDGPPEQSHEAKVLELWHAGTPINQITLALYGYQGGVAFYEVVDILAAHGIHPAADREAKEQSDTERVLRLWDDGERTVTTITQAVFGTTGGTSWYKVKQILKDHGRLEA